MNILSLDGGGIRGVVTARLLWRIQRACPGFLKYVDVIAGTSTGGIQALKIAKDGDEADMTQLVNLYRNKGHLIFRNRDWLDSAPRKIRTAIMILAMVLAGAFLAMGHEYFAMVTLFAGLGMLALIVVISKMDELFRANYSAEHMEEVLKGELGVDTTIRDLKKMVLIPAFDMRTWGPKFFDNFPGNMNDLDQKLWDVARCTSAAPTYWPSHLWCLDGGLFANNPSDSAVAACIRHLKTEALESGEAKDEDEAFVKSLGKITVLSLGTGKVPHTAPRNPTWDAGIVNVIPLLLNVVMDGAVEASAFRVKQALNGRHVRINPELPTVIDLADVDSVEDLVRIADLEDIEPAVKLIQEHWMPTPAAF